MISSRGKMNLKEKIQLVLGGVIIIAIIGTLYNWPTSIIDLLINWSMAIMISLILSAVAGKLIESFSGDLLKNIFLVVKIWKFDVSISVFTILTFILKVWLFR